MKTTGIPKKRLERSRKKRRKEENKRIESRKISLRKGGKDWKPDPGKLPDKG